jgi:hypothetical protein
MTIVSSGAISFNSLVGEYGSTGSARALTHYYRGGQSGLVLNHSNNSSIPTSGTIALSNFYGQSNTTPNDLNVVGTCGVYVVSGGKYSDTYQGINSTTDMSGVTMGSWSDNSFTNPAGTSTFTITMAISYTSTLGSATSYLGISGNQGGGSLQSVIGHTQLRIGGTTYITDNGNAGAYVSSHNHTRYSIAQTNTMPTSGSHTFNWA